MAAVFISNIVQALTGFAGVMLSIPPTILLYGPDMAKAVSYTHLDVYKRQGVGMAWMTAATLPMKEKMMAKTAAPPMTQVLYTPCLLYTSRCV